MSEIPFEVIEELWINGEITDEEWEQYCEENETLILD